MSDEPIVVLRKLIDAWNAHDFDACRDLIDPDVVHHTPASGSSPDYPIGTPRGRDAMLDMWTLTLQFFPDMVHRIDDYAQTGDRVALRCTSTGTHTVDFFGTPPSGKPYAMPMMMFSKVRDGRIVEHWGISDNLMLVSQIGGELPSWVLGRDAPRPPAAEPST